jgi:predicted MFS family arabinose efflux permease
MNKLLFLGACLVALTSTPALAQTGGASAIIVQTYFSGSNTLYIAVTRADGQTEETEVKDAMNVKAHVVAIAMQRVLAKLVQEGYTLKSTPNLGANQVTTLIFEKRQ